ncbi:UNVERIFIED_ORG: hypothetical protein [Escherichia phage CMSTMSU]
MVNSGKLRHITFAVRNPYRSGVGKLTTQTFIERAEKVHNNLYDYSKVVYKNNSTKVCIIDPVYGEFWQEPSSHLKGAGSPQRAIENGKNLNQKQLKHL